MYVETASWRQGRFHAVNAAGLLAVCLERFAGNCSATRADLETRSSPCCPSWGSNLSLGAVAIGGASLSINGCPTRVLPPGVAVTQAGSSHEVLELVPTLEARSSALKCGKAAGAPQWLFVKVPGEDKAP